MERVLIRIREHKKAYLKFVKYLETKTNIKNVSTYLQLKDELAFSYIQQYLNDEYGLSFLIGTHNAITVIDKTHLNLFGIIIKYKDLNVITIIKKNKSYSEILNELIYIAFKNIEKNML